MPKKQPREVRYEHFMDGKFLVIQLGQMDIWDGGTVALFRDITHHLMKENKCKIGLDVSGVKHFPEGFFGYLFTLKENGAKVRLYWPEQRVRAMLWFRMFFRTLKNSDEHCFEMVNLAKAPTYGDPMMRVFNENIEDPGDGDDDRYDETDDETEDVDATLAEGS